MAPDALANLYWPMQIHLGRHPFWPVRKGKTKYKYNFLKAVRQSYFFIYHHYHCFMVWFTVWVWVCIRGQRTPFRKSVPSFPCGFQHTSFHVSLLSEPPQSTCTSTPFFTVFETRSYLARWSSITFRLRLAPNWQWPSQFLNYICEPLHPPLWIFFDLENIFT